MVDEETAAKDAEKMLSGKFSMDDFLTQIKTVSYTHLTLPTRDLV